MSLSKLENLFISYGYTLDDARMFIDKLELSEEHLYDKVKANYEWLVCLYDKKDIIPITLSFPTIYTISIDNLEQKIVDLVKLGYTPEEVIRMTRNNPSIYGYKIETIKDKIRYMNALGYTLEEVRYISKVLPSFYGLDINSIDSKINNIASLGYTREEVIAMTKKLPTLFSHGIDNLSKKMTDLISLGYTYEDVIRMTKTFPTIYSYLIDNIQIKMKQIELLGYTPEEVIRITRGLPNLFGLSIEKISERLNFYNEIGMHDLALVKPIRLMQGVDLSYARYCFYQDMDIEINMDNYLDLFNYDIDYFIDACDTMTTKKEIIKECIRRKIKFISSMGTGNKLNPLELKVTDISKTRVCPLARVMRLELKKRNIKKLVQSELAFFLRYRYYFIHFFSIIFLSIRIQF